MEFNSEGRNQSCSCWTQENTTTGHFIMECNNYKSEGQVDIDSSNSHAIRGMGEGLRGGRHGTMYGVRSVL